MVNDLGVNQTPEHRRHRLATSRAACSTGYVDRIAINQVIADARADSISPKISDSYLRDLNALCGQYETRANRLSFPTIRGKKALAAPTCAPPSSHRTLSRARSPTLKTPGQVPDAREALRRRAQDLGAPQPRRWPRPSRPARRPTTAGRPRSSPTTTSASSTAQLQRGRPHRLRGQPPVVESALVDRERFSEHLAAPMGRGVVLSGGFDGAAGGARLRGSDPHLRAGRPGDRVVEASFDASGCGALTAAGSAAVMLVSGALGAGRRARGCVARSPRSSAGSRPGKLHAADLAADALHRALGAAARACASVPFDSGSRRWWR